jgi:hypothetical protein
MMQDQKFVNESRRIATRLNFIEGEIGDLVVSAEKIGATGVANSLIDAMKKLDDIRDTALANIQ